MGLWMWFACGLSLQAATGIAGDTTAYAPIFRNSYLSDTVILTTPEFPIKTLRPSDRAM